MPTRSYIRLRLFLVLGAVSCTGTTVARTPPATGTSGGVSLSSIQSACAMDFDSTEAIIARDYAGYGDRMRESADRIRALTDSVRLEVRAVGSDSACTRSLQRWIAAFGERDHHLQLWRFRPAPTAAPQGARTVSEPAEDPRRPTVRYVGDTVAVLTLPTFNMRYKRAIDSLMATHRPRLLSTPYLVVDVRSNGGGATASYESVMALIYADPYRVEGMDVWATDGNINAYRALLDTGNVPESIKAEARALLPRMEAKRGSFVTWDEDRTISLDTVYALPRRVGVLIARMCASSCEQFVLDAGQSRKVTLLGRQNTAGMVDYGNTRRVILPSSARQISMPTSRSRRLPGRPMDYKGVAPDVLIPKEEADAVAFAIRFLSTGAKP
jgi:hypothetical protein